MTTSRHALIGHTGFVGSNLDGPHITHRFNSRNIETARGQGFDTVICAGVQAVKWWANQNPEEDWKGIVQLLDVLSEVTADRFILISTVDVFATPRAVDEATPIDTDGLHPYGLHRHKVEAFVRDRFADAAQIIRLPGLFGPGLKKNVIFDLLEDRDVSGFNPGSRFQFYDLARLASDIDRIRDAGLDLVHLATEPLRVDSIARALGKDINGFSEAAPSVSYDFHTRHGTVWDMAGTYIEPASATLARMAAFGESWGRA